MRGAPDLRAHAAQQRARRKAAFDRGMCAVCCCRERRENLRTCEQCGSNTHRKAPIWNLCCQAAGFHRAGCKEA